MAGDDHDDLHAEQTEGFKVGEKKTLDEYQNLGASHPPPPHLIPPHPSPNTPQTRRMRP
jgi:hypothetical protein